MPAVTYLVTIVDLDLRTSPADDAPFVDTAPAGFVPGVAPRGPERSAEDPYDRHAMDLSALHLAVLADGRQVTLLDDRGWGAHGDDIWRRTSVEEIHETARVVVGPDEASGRRSQADMDANHWGHLADILRRQSVIIDATELSRLPHEVELSQRLQTRLANS